MSRTYFVLSTFVLGIACLLHMPATSAAAERAPNIVFILADDK